MIPARHEYLGDAVYARIAPDDFHPLTLMTGSHDVEQASNVIYFEAEVVKALLKHLLPEKSG